MLLTRLWKVSGVIAISVTHSSCITTTAFVRHLHQRLQKQQTLIRLNDVYSPTAEFSGQHAEIVIRILST